MSNYIKTSYTKTNHWPTNLRQEYFKTGTFENYLHALFLCQHPSKQSSQNYHRFATGRFTSPMTRLLDPTPSRKIIFCDAMYCSSGWEEAWHRDLHCTKFILLSYESPLHQLYHKQQTTEATNEYNYIEWPQLLCTTMMMAILQSNIYWLMSRNHPYLLVCVCLSFY